MLFPFVQGRNWRVGRVGNCPPSFWQNRRSHRPAAARHITLHYCLPTQYLVATYAPEYHCMNTDMKKSQFLFLDNNVHGILFSMKNLPTYLVEFWFNFQSVSLKITGLTYNSSSFNFNLYSFGKLNPALHGPHNIFEFQCVPKLICTKYTYFQICLSKIFPKSQNEN